MDKKEKTGVLNVRDLVNVGLFSVLIFIATFLSGMIGFIPVLMPVVPFVYGIVSGPVYMLYFTKIKKAGMLFIQTIVVTLAFVATGHGPWVLLTAVIGGLLGEVVLRNGRYKSVKHASFTPVEMGNESAISDFTFKCLDAGEYRLTEIKAPSNYIPLEEPILFTIIEESNGVFKIKLNTENSKVTLEEGTLTIKVANEKTVTTEITVDKKWFRADGTEFHPQDGEISYNLIQVLTTEGGESSEKIYKSGETLTSQDGWQKTYSNLPAADINGNGEKEICTYYVKEILIADYSTSYSNGSVGESEDPSAAALSSGTITVKNTEKMKFILPETGGTGRGILYIAGVFLLGISMILLGNKNSSFYECLHKKG